MKFRAKSNFIQRKTKDFFYFFYGTIPITCIFWIARYVFVVIHFLRPCMEQIERILNRNRSFSINALLPAILWWTQMKFSETTVKKSGQLGAAKRAVNSLCSGLSEPWDRGAVASPPPSFLTYQLTICQKRGRLSTPNYYFPHPIIFKPSYGPELLLYRAVSDWS